MVNNSYLYIYSMKVFTTIHKTKYEIMKIKKAKTVNTSRVKSQTSGASTALSCDEYWQVPHQIIHE